MTWPAEKVEEARGLLALGTSATVVARIVGVPRRTVVDWRAGRLPEGGAAAGCRGLDAHLDALDAPVYTYLLGMYLGDGCLSAYPRDVFRLRIALDAAYPLIIEECAAAIAALAPGRRVGWQQPGPGWIELSAYWKCWPCLFPQHGPGKKHTRRITLESWQRDLVAQAPEALLRGLVHSDGCRFENTGRNWSHPRYSFANLSGDIRQIFCDACDLLGIHWTVARPKTIYVSRKADVARLDEFIGPKR